VHTVLRTRVTRRKRTAWCWAAWANPALIEPASAAPLCLPRTQPIVIC
jgi:hypothetical protein